MIKRQAFTMALLAGTALIAGPALAADNTAAQTQMQMQQLQDQLRSMQQQLDALKAADAAQKDALMKETAAREAAEKAERDANLAAGGHNVIQSGQVIMIPPANPKVVESATHSFTLSSPDGAWTIQPTGRIHMDFGAYLSQSPEGTTGPGTATGGKLQGGVNARRVRLGVTGKANNDFTYQLILDGGGTNDGLPAGGSTPLVNTAQIGYTGIANTIIEAGYFAQYFTLDEATSSNNILFMERASPVTVGTGVMAGDPRFGAGFRTWQPNWWFGAYMVSAAPGVSHALLNRGLSSFQRFTYNPIQDGLSSVHIGVGVQEIFEVPTAAAAGFGSVTLSDRPEMRIDTTTFLSTGGLGTATNPVTGIQIYNVETAAAFGSFFYQGEGFHYVVNRQGKTKAEFDGAYLETSYTFGGRHSYTANCGCYGGVVPVDPFNPLRGGMGAIELAARFSYVNLVDQYDANATAASQPNLVNGGQQTNLTLGVNWYWNSNMLWKLNYIRSNFDKKNPRTTALVGATKVGIDLDILAARFQVMF